MTQAFCSACGKNHDNVDCPWKPAVSGMYEHNAPHITVPNLSNRHHHTITRGCTQCGGPHSVLFCPKGTYAKANPLVNAASPKDNPWDNQVGGQHYKKGIQPFEYAMANNLNSLEFSVVKYLRKKGDKAKRLEDLKKAKDCLEKLIWWEEHDGKI